MNGVIYARYSEGPNQTEQSIEGQVADCMAYAERVGIDIVETYIDRHISGKSIAGRDEFQRMIYDAERGAFECVIVWKIDRFGRNRQDIAINRMKLKKAGVKLLYAEESVPEGPEGIILESVLEGLAEYYSADLSQKVKRGIRESAKKGKYCGASVPIGYKTDNERHVIVDEREAAAVREAFDMHIAGATTKEIIEMFTERGVVTKRGKKITPAVVYRMLRNERYIGAWELAGVTLDVPAIIPEEIFYKAATCFKTSRNNAASTSKTDYLLSCKCYCGYCNKLLRGSSATSHTGKKHYYYACATKKAGKSCELKAIKKDVLENVVIEATKEKMLSSEIIEQLVKEVMKIQEETLENDILTALNRQLKDAEKRQGKLVTALEYGGEIEVVTNRLKQIDEEIKELKRRIAAESIAKPTITEDAIRAWLESFKAGDLTDEKVRARLIDTFIDHVEVKNGEALIFFRMFPGGPGRPFGQGSPTVRQVE